MTEQQKANYIATMSVMRQRMHEIVDNLINNAIGAGLGGEQISQAEKPLNDLNKDPARVEYQIPKAVKTLRQAVKTQRCPICGRELPLGQFRSSDNHLHDECNQCRTERYEENKSKRKNKKAS